MEKEELRIGNKVNITDNDGGIDTVIAIQRDECICYEYGAVNWFLIKPIPLSHEWMEKFGAIFPHHDFRCQIGELCFYWNPNGALFLNESGWNESISNYPIDAVHKIQNLYHSVTGKELELNP